MCVYRVHDKKGGTGSVKDTACEKFSNVSAPVLFLYKFTKQLTFENFYLLLSTVVPLLVDILKRQRPRIFTMNI